MNPRLWLLFTLCRIALGSLLTSEASESPPKIRPVPVASFLATGDGYSGVYDKSRFKGVMPLREAVERSDANSTLALAFSADDTTLYVGGAANGLVQVWDISYWTHQSYGTTSSTTTTTTTAWQSRTMRQELARIKKNAVTGRLHPDNHPDIFSHGQDKINIENPDRTTPTPPPMEIGLEQTIDVGSRVRDLVMDDSTGTLFVATDNGHLISFNTRDVTIMANKHIPHELATQDVVSGAKVNKLVLSSDGNFVCAVGTEIAEEAPTMADAANATTSFLEAVSAEQAASRTTLQYKDDPEERPREDIPSYLRCWLTQHFRPPEDNATQMAPVRVIERKLGGEPLALALSQDNQFIYTGGYDRLIVKWRITGLTPSTVGSNLAMADVFDTYSVVQSLVSTPPPQSYVMAGLSNGRAGAFKMLRDTPLPEEIAFSKKLGDHREKIDLENAGRDMKVAQFLYTTGGNPGRVDEGSGMGSVDAVDYITDLDNKGYYVTAGWRGLPDGVDLHPPPVTGDSPTNDLPPSGDNPCRLIFWTLEAGPTGLQAKKEFELERVGLNWVNTLKLSNDQNWLVSGGNDGSLTLWSTVYMHQNKRAAFATFLDGTWKDTTPESPDIDLTSGMGPRPRPAPSNVARVGMGGNQDSMDDPASDVEPAPVAATGADAFAAAAAR